VEAVVVSERAGASDGGRQTLLVALCVLGLVVGATALGPDGGGGFASGPEFDLSALLELFGDSDDGEPGCAVSLLGEPVPGETVPVVVVSESGPVEGARVWLNDRAIGRTNESGRVAGRIPYERPVEIRARVPDGVDCTAGSGDSSFDRRGLDAGPAVASGVTGAASPVAGSDPGAVGPAGAAAASGPTNVTQTVQTDGRIDVAVSGRPFPGETVTVLARIGGRPVPDATVTVDGQQVGETDDAGRYELTVPDDGTARFTLGVERGDYSGRTRVDVALLDVTVSPTTVLALPGQPAVLNVTLGAETVDGARVAVAGESVGETGPDGKRRVTLPTDPTATIRVRAVDQTATVSMARLYAGTVAVVGFVLAALGAVAVGLARRVSGTANTPSADAVGSRTRRLLNRVVRRALAVATWLTGVFDDAEGRLRAFWRDVRASPRAVVARLRALPGAIRGGLAALVGWLRALPSRLRAFRRAGDDGAETVTRGAAAAVPDAEGDPTTLRERWRTFARWVTPDRWRKRTPGEVVRAATAEGYPQESATDLATAFREVEYGGAERTEERTTRAREAFDALAAHRRAEGAPSVTGGSHAGREGRER
jgi:hypothetical protein